MNTHFNINLTQGPHDSVSANNMWNHSIFHPICWSIHTGLSGFSSCSELVFFKFLLPTEKAHEAHYFHGPKVLLRASQMVVKHMRQELLCGLGCVSVLLLNIKITELIMS